MKALAAQADKVVTGATREQAHPVAKPLVDLTAQIGITGTRPARPTASRRPKSWAAVRQGGPEGVRGGSQRCWRRGAVAAAQGGKNGLETDANDFVFKGPDGDRASPNCSDHVARAWFFRRCQSRARAEQAGRWSSSGEQPGLRPVIIQRVRVGRGLGGSVDTMRLPSGRRLRRAVGPHLVAGQQLAAQEKAAAEKAAADKAAAEKAAAEKAAADKKTP